MTTWKMYVSHLMIVVQLIGRRMYSSENHLMTTWKMYVSHLMIIV